MVDEIKLGTFAVGALFICALDCYFWMFGGRSGTSKGWRRFVGAVVQTIGLNVFSLITGTWMWQFLASFILETLSRTLGYGADVTLEKIIKRSVFALGSLGVGVFLAWGLGFTGSAMVILACQAVASIVSIVLGVKNPVPPAVEEVFVCLSLKYINYLYIFSAV